MNSTIAGFHLSSQQKAISLRPFVEDARLEIRIEGSLDPVRLRRAFDELVERHEILRTTYQRSAGMTAPFQVVNETAAPEVKTALGETFAIQLPALSADLASLYILFQELVDAYAGKALPDTLQYADYAQWQADQGQSEERTLVPPLVLPFQKKQSGPVRETVAFSCGEAGPDAMLAAWQLLLGRLTGEPEVAVSRVQAGRDHEEFANAIGLYEEISGGDSELTVGFSVEDWPGQLEADGVVFFHREGNDYAAIRIGVALRGQR